MKSLLSKRDKRLLARVGLIACIGAAAEISLLAGVYKLIEVSSNQELRASLVFSHNADEKIVVSMIAGVMVVTIGLTWKLRTRAMESYLMTAGEVATSVTARVFSTLLKRPYKLHRRVSTSEVINLLTKDCDQMYGCIHSILAIGVNGIVATALIVSLGVISLKLAVIAMLTTFGLYAAIYKAYYRGFEKDGKEISKAHNEIIKNVSKAVRAIRQVKLEGTEDEMTLCVKRSVGRYRYAFAAVNYRAAAPKITVESVLLLGLAVGATVFWGTGAKDSVAVIGAFAIGGIKLMQPLQQIFANAGTYRANRASLERIERIMRMRIESEGAVVSKARLINVGGGSLAIECKNVGIKTDDNERWIQRGLSFEVLKGELLRIRGESGCGKSSLLDAICGLRDIEEGCIQIFSDNRDRRHVIGLVSQDFYLLGDTIEECITWGKNRMDTQDVSVSVADIMSACCLAGDGEELRKGSRIGENGKLLSGGQRQRVAIARSLYMAPDILVLDEATTGVSLEMEEIMLERVRELYPMITIILVTHRKNQMIKAREIDISKEKRG